MRLHSRRNRRNISAWASFLGLLVPSQLPVKKEAPSARGALEGQDQQGQVQDGSTAATALAHQNASAT